MRGRKAGRSRSPSNGCCYIDDLIWNGPAISIIGIHAKDKGWWKELIDYYGKGIQW